MNLLKKLVLGLAGFVFMSSMIVTAWTVVLEQNVADENSLKSTVGKSGIYDQVVESVLNEASKNVASNGGEVLPLDDPKLRSAIESAITPQVIEENTNTFVDNTFGWLRGESLSSDSLVDLTETRDRLFSNLGAYAKERYQALPLCTPQTIPEEVNPLTVPCRAPEGVVDIDAEIARAIDQAKTQNEFLADPVIRPNSLGTTDGEVIMTKAAGPVLAPALLRGAWIVSALSAVVAGLLIVFLSVRKLYGLRRIGLLTAVSGALLLLSVLIGKAILGAATNAVGNEVASASNVSLANNVVLPLISSFERSISSGLVIFGATYAIGGALIIIGVSLWLRRERQNIEPTLGKPQPPATGPPTTI